MHPHRRIVLVLIALVYLVVTTGSLGRLVDIVRPLAHAEAAADDFPCAHHVCGCTDAETCRTSCCCFPRVPAACPHCADGQAHEHAGGHSTGPRTGPVVRCGCPAPVAFLEGRQPDQDRRHGEFLSFALPPAGTVSPSRATVAPAGFREPPSRVPISSC